MKIALFFLKVFLTAMITQGQSRTITGKVLDNEFHPIPRARIYDPDGNFLTSTDSSGYFEITQSTVANSLAIGAIGAEMKRISFSNDCAHLEIILLWETIHDFVSSRKVNRERRKQFNLLPNLHRAAFKNGAFRTEKPCYTEEFIPSKWK